MRSCLIILLLSKLFAQIDYNDQIQPIFDNNCISCHNGGGAYAGNLDLSSYAETIEGGGSGNTVVPNDHASSILYQRIILPESDQESMPRNSTPLSQSDIDLVAQWIDEGALETPEDIDCYADDGTEGVEFWNNCFSIENTTSIDFYGIPDSIEFLPLELFGLINLETMSIMYSNISGPLPAELGNLTNLSVLNLANNQLSGSIPPEISNLINLTRLDLSSNQFSGNIIPEIGLLNNLNSLNLSGNQFTGEIPIEIFNLTGLEGETVPIGMGALVFHPGLNLSNNNLMGTIPVELDNLVNLKSIDLSYNQLNGSIPQSLYSLDSLRSINLSNNFFTGQISSDIGNLSHLEGYFYGGFHHGSGAFHYPSIDVSNNQLSGFLPHDICNLPIDGSNYWASTGSHSSNFSNNQFCGPFPSCLEDYIGDQDTSSCAQMYIQKVFVEDFTAAEWCPYCPVGSLTMGDLIDENEMEIISIQWHLGSQYFDPNDCTVRNDSTCFDVRSNIYNVTGIPTEVFNGSNILIGANVSWDNYARYDSVFQLIDDMVSSFGMEITGTKSGTTVSYAVNVSSENIIEMNDNDLHIFIVEDSILTTWNYQSFGDSIDFAHNVVRMWTTDTMHIDQGNLSYSFNGSFDLQDHPWDHDQVKVTAIMQNRSTNEIYQASQKNINAFEFLSTNDKENNNSNLPLEFFVSQNYPNPFNPTTNIRFNIPEKSNVSIFISDIKGRKIKTLLNGRQIEGDGSVSWDATDNFGNYVSAGMYFYTVESGAYRDTKKMLLIK